jgi:hypothetical protein
MLTGEVISDEPSQFFRLLRNAAIKQRRYFVIRTGKGREKEGE